VKARQVAIEEKLLTWEIGKLLGADLSRTIVLSPKMEVAMANRNAWSHDLGGAPSSDLVGPSIDD
jgi:hypothetical protein